ncbi:RIP metalloprotease RseP [Blautia liquoris]|uniref:RIP metalloprotease RseP n=1 Tax=Blautia liquoris TaxID=2779518 RepID=UPI002E2FEAE0|nr:RIP metalloprotease RseP [Blautia liquoris]
MIINIIIAVLIFSIVVIIHEMGHFLLAKANHITVTEFSVGMGPTLLSTVKNDTKYSLKLLPFGGSCMMLGEDDNSEAEGAFNSKSVWARMSVIIAGPLFNMILAFFLSIIIISFVGSDPPRITEVEAGSPAAETGLKEGDLITRYEGSRISIGRDLYTKVNLDGIPSDNITLSYKRDGKTHDVTYVPDSEEKYMLGFTHESGENKAEVISLMPGYPLAKAGVQVGDIILELNHTVINSNQDLEDYMSSHPFSDDSVDITYQHKDRIHDATVTPRLTKNAALGFVFNLGREKQPPLLILKYSVKEIGYWIKTTVKSLAMLITGKFTVNDLSGPVGVVDEIGKTINSSRADGGFYVIMNLLNFMILLSANLGVMNLIPFPALDGGRLLFLIIEAIRGKGIKQEVEGMINFAGLMLLMALMVFVMFNDIRKIF